MSKLLEVRDLRVRFETELGCVSAVDGLDLDIAQRQRFALVGESGSGKSATALAILGLIDPPGLMAAEQISFEGKDLTSLSDEQLRQIRGSRIGLVMQDPLGSLSPVFSIGEQIAETVRYHESARRAAAMSRAIELLAHVGIPDPRARARDYPHQLSGGMRQRVAIAIALVCDPTLLIADEPTTALDVTIQAQVLELLVRLSEERGMAVLLISHDLGVVAGFAERIAVMYAGHVVEQGAVDDVYYRPTHPYTLALLASQPGLGARRGRLVSIPGNPPDPSNRPSGCSFHPRCQHQRGRERCRVAEPSLRSIVPPDHLTACHFAEELCAQARARTQTR
jgi:oligopeptide/dipeptide ABC transporter ATP-binding protein